MTVDLGRTEWERARDAFRDAQLLLSNGGFDGAASRAYYAAFHAVTALFAREGRTFTKHSALTSALHRDLVKAGRVAGEHLGVVHDVTRPLADRYRRFRRFRDRTGPDIL